MPVEYIGRICKESQIYNVFKFEGAEPEGEQIIAWVKPEYLFSRPAI
jgi:hypothetical protein